ncbi:MAG: histidine--tRNA ligase [Clostridiales bacterium]|jgi:histidyl-tRNA synthetase|nr:histidine--tRNA ligase [Clostridiales bacterium]
MITKPKGTIDILPADSGKWHFIENTARETARLYNLREIRTPNFEHTELFLRGVGETTDIVNKEMYTFTDKGGRSVTLKPEGTAGVARAYVENGLANEPKPLKMYYITPVYRYERPQAGRLREHRQFGVEIYGAANPSIDAETIMIARDTLKRLGIESAALNINSVGCPDCRKAYHETLRAYLKERLPQMCPTCNERFEKNPLRILDCKSPGCAGITANAPHITDYLCEPCKGHFDGVKKILDIYGVQYKVNPYIVRGLDYYNRTVFEFVADSERAQGTICGGGRYDRLVGDVGGSPEPAVGFGMGIERLINIMEAEGLLFDTAAKIDAYLVRADDSAAETIYKMAAEFRAQERNIEFDHLNRSVKAQFKAADKLGAEYAVVVGADELRSGAAKVKNLKTGKETAVPIQEACDYVCGSFMDDFLKEEYDEEEYAEMDDKQKIVYGKIKRTEKILEKVREAYRNIYFRKNKDK